MSQEDMIRHIDDLECYLARRIFDIDDYVPVTEPDQELQVPKEYDRIYLDYLYSQIDFTDGRQDLYQLSFGQYMNIYNDLQKYINSRSAKIQVRFSNYM
jgi:hypothetical protein